MAASNRSDAVDMRVAMIHSTTRLRGSEVTSKCARGESAGKTPKRLAESTRVRLTSSGALCASIFRLRPSMPSRAAFIIMSMRAACCCIA